MNITQPVSSHISNVGFGLLSTEEIKALSVRKITNPQTFNSLLHATVNGLYDPSLGSLLNGFCRTCNLRESDGCPGHCGHIELPLMVYHPTFMDQCLKLLRGKCVFCHHFRLSRTVISQYCCRLRLVHNGLLQESEEMVDAVRSLLESGKVANQDSDSDLDTGGDDSGLVHAQNTYTIKAIKAHLKAGGSRAATNNQAVGEARTELVRQFFADIGKAAKCAGCGGFSPKYRKDKYLKIFMKSLPRKHQIANTQSERRMRNPLVILNSKRKQRTQTKPNSNGTVFDEGVADLDMSEANSSEGEGEALDIEMDDLEEHIEDDMHGAHTLSQPKPRQKGQPEETQNFFMTSEEVHAALVLLFEEESEILRLVYSPRSKGRALGNLSADMFFISTLLVPPIKYRPEHPSQTEEISEASKNRPYKAILLACQKIAEIHREIKTGQINDLIPTQRTPRNYNHLKLAQVELQDAVNALIDKSSSTGSNNASQEDGVKQLLEKKQGLFRMNMMGKRVNFAGRSVISPDPNIETNEIGVPPIFAKKLTYPEPVTNHNYYELKEAILNGPDNWPGAVAVENEDGQVISLRGKSADDRLAIANQLLAPSKNTMNGRYGKKVHRHLNNGDIVIMNRQPTLHKPSMMCHRTRVLPGEKTIRMHYANCNTYNADFDGDEMNMHFPQNELARAEANTIADTDHQYLSGTAGKPLRGLIQDHITMGVHLTNRDTFFDREEYQQLVYSAMRPEDNHTVTGTLITVTPAILKPKPLWTGKQVISTVLKNITSKHHMGLTLTSKSQTAGDRWGAFTEEEIVKIQDGELLTGIIDKKQIGPASGGLVHAVYETFGHTTAGRLLSVLGRLLTKLLHIRAFSCGVEDLILTPEGEKVRLENLEAAKTLGLKVATKYVTLEQRNPTSTDPELLRRLEMVQRDEEQMKGLDEITKKHNMLLSSEITKACLPDGLVKVFPKNQMQAMTGTGAKGTPVNANLISCNLGQQVLEGRRVPTMVSGKTLPCFKPYESSIRAGGYIVDRFLTGVKPQEYYFHAMAGREGLIDTAVKTSRSGYLQRCIVKGMEGLKVEYDISVRDADGSVVQFLYGEDGLDVCKQTYLRQFKFMAENFFSLYNNMQVQELYPRIQCTEASAHNKKASKGFVKRGLDEPRDPVLSIYSPSRYAGSMSENYYLALRQYIDENKDKVLEDKKKGIKGVARKKNFEALLEVKYLNSLVEPGEAVGVVAGQSVGEPSTQMTLNTFHLAGHSSKNVTLGIPRLREIVMTASSKISTPMMTLHLNPEVDQEGGENFAKELGRLSLSDVVDKITVRETVKKGVAHSQSKFYQIRFKFFPAEEYCEEYNIKAEDVLDAIAKKLLPALQKNVRAEWKKKGIQKTRNATDAAPELGTSAGKVEQESSRPARAGAEDDSDVGSDIDEEDASAARKKANRAEDDEWVEPDVEEQELASQMSEEEIIDDEDDGNGNDMPTELHTDDEASDVDGTEDAGQSRAKKIHIHRSAAELDAWVKGIADNNAVLSFRFDPSGGWCEVTLEYPASSPKVLMLQLVEQFTRNAVIRAVPGIKSCFYNKDNKIKDPMTGELRVEPVIVTEGINLLAIRDCQDILNPHKVFTNDIAAIRAYYGVEACRATIVEEMNGVFAGHGIDVDMRHLNLIADCMTRTGSYLAFNRAGLRNQTSPFMKMSFETTIGFLKDAVLCEDYDDLKNPSARIVVGRVNGVGTGSFDLLVPTAETVHERSSTVEV